MSETEPETYPAGVDVPGTPGPFPFGLAAFAMAMMAVITGLAGMIVGIMDWFPMLLGQPVLYWIGFVGAIVCSGLAFRQGRTGWAAASTIIVVVTLTPLFPMAVVMLLISMD